jgi:hypothetical protein
MALNQTTLDDTFDVWRTNTNLTSTSVGDLTQLNTVTQLNLVDAINETKANASDEAFINALLFGG